MKGEIECAESRERKRDKMKQQQERATGICTDRASECNQGPANTFKTRVKVRGLVKERKKKRKKRDKKRERGGM